jgi:hypothetical protein
MFKSFLQEEKNITTAAKAGINDRVMFFSFNTKMVKSAFWSNFAFAVCKDEENYCRFLVVYLFLHWANATGNQGIYETVFGG